MDLKNYLERLAYAVAILAAGGSAWQYRRNSGRERTRWLFDLYRRFYDRSEFKALRFRLDSGDSELRKQEIQAMFDYTLKMLANDHSALAYIRKYGYEELDSLLKDLGYAS